MSALPRGRARRLGFLLCLVTVPPAATLVWLGLTILDQDRTIAADQVRDQREAAVRGVTGSLDQSLVEAARYLDQGSVPDGMVRLTLTDAGARAEPAAAVAWLPRRPEPTPLDDPRFSDAERLEYSGDTGAALIRYRELASTGDRSQRAGSLMRIARIERRARQWDRALAAYAEMAEFADVAIAGSPADLQARRQRCDVLLDAGRQPALRRAADALETDLLAGRWALDKAAWNLTTDDLARWLGRPVSVPAARTALSRVADELWMSRDRGNEQGVQRTTAGDAAAPVTVLSRRDSEGVIALVITNRVLDEWARLALAGVPGVTALAMLGPGDQPFTSSGQSPAATSGTAVNTVRADAAATGLPWTVAVDTIPNLPSAGAPGSRGGLFALGLVAILVLVGGGGYLLWRVLQQELAVSRLQTEFVSAVSHEFRTPLTSLRHMTELLSESDDLPPERRAAFYDALGRDTGRLHRLVESLLDFARMQDGRRPYALHPVDAGALAGRVVQEFGAAADGPDVASPAVIDLEVEPGADLTIRADEAALGSALWNLLDNAVKYATARPEVHVGVHRNGAGIAIDVRDEGPGIPAAEQKEIFGRFVRGTDATRRGIRGTGLGLSMVAHIVNAHGGHVNVTSEPGAGSTFTITLPSGGGA